MNVKQECDENVLMLLYMFRNKQHNLYVWTLKTNLRS